MKRMLLMVNVFEMRLIPIPRMTKKCRALDVAGGDTWYPIAMRGLMLTDRGYLQRVPRLPTLLLLLVLTTARGADGKAILRGIATRNSMLMVGH
jgi:hypothetical protein